MEIKDRRTPSAATVAKKHGISIRKKFRTAHKNSPTDDFDHNEGTFPKGIIKKEQEAFVDWYSQHANHTEKQRLKKVAAWKAKTPWHKRVKAALTRKHPGIRYGMGSKARYGKPDKIKEAYVDPLEAMHNATRARILQGAKEGKYWLLRAEDRDEIINKIMETVTTASIGGYSKPLGVDARDITMGGRNKWIEREKRFALSKLLNRSVSAPSP